MMEFTVDVGWTNQRPVIPDQFVSRVRVLEESATDAELTAAYIVMGRSKSAIFGAPCEMVTSTRICL